MTTGTPSGRRAPVCLLSLLIVASTLPLGCRGGSPENTATQQGQRVVGQYLRAYRDMDTKAMHEVFTAAPTRDDAAFRAAIRGRQIGEGRITDWWYKEAYTDPSGSQYLAQVNVATTKRIALMTFDVRLIEGDWTIYYLKVEDTLEFDKLAPDMQRTLTVAALKSRFVHPDLTP